MFSRPIPILIALLVLLLRCTSSHSQPANTPGDHFLVQILGTPEERDRSFQWLSGHWQPGFTIMGLEVAQLTDSRSIRERMLSFVESKTKQRYSSWNDWYVWLWAQNYELPVGYARFKGQLYRLLDRKFEGYFSNDRTAHIRLDEVRWGGVGQDGIPPLRNPTMIPAAEANYLGDDHIIFGIEVNGDARAYPKRILGWHELFTDEVGGVPVAGVYCTLCGSMILYGTKVNGVGHDLGTSGFLYRSNKLMYDQATQSLWSTILGKPVIGPLADGADIELPLFNVVTTTWGAWKARHPKSTVLSLETGFNRDYREGAAYREYFGTDDLMFTVPAIDTSLNNKDEVLCFYQPELSDKPLAISMRFLQSRKRYHTQIGESDIVVLTDQSGGSRAYYTEGVRFKKWDKDKIATDKSGAEWALSEPHLTASDGRKLNRVPSHQAFWFGWKAIHPNTRLVR